MSHCPTCHCGRRVRVQASRKLAKSAGSIDWAEHLAAYAVYASRYGTNQSAERIHERQGFSYGELTDLLGHEPTTWLPIPASVGVADTQPSTDEITPADIEEIHEPTEHRQSEVPDL